MSVDTHIPSRTTQTLSFTIRNMLFSFRIPVLFRHSEIDYMYDVGHLGSRSTDQEVVGFDISVDQVLFVNRLNSAQLHTPSSRKISALNTEE